MVLMHWNLIKQAVYDSMDKSFLAESDGWRMMDMYQELAANFGRCRRRHNSIPRKTRTAVEGTISCRTQ